MFRSLNLLPRWVWWMPAISWATVIFLLSRIKGASLPKVEIANFDKVVHFGLFFTLSVLLYIGLRRGSGFRSMPAAVVATCLASLYGASDEIHQLWTEGRSSDIKDWMADTLGASLILIRGFTRRDP